MSGPIINPVANQLADDISVQNNSRNWNFTKKSLKILKTKLENHKPMTNSVAVVSVWLGDDLLHNLKETFRWLRLRLKADELKLICNLDLKDISFRNGYKKTDDPVLEVRNLRFIPTSFLLWTPTTVNPFQNRSDRRMPGLEGIQYVIENLPQVLNELKGDALAFPGLSVGGNSMPVLFQKDDEVFVELYVPGMDIGRPVWVCIFVEPGPITSYSKEAKS